MNRAPNATEALQGIKAAQAAGYGNLTIDLIYGTPGLSNDGWQQNLETMAGLQIPHFSAYALTVEEGTALHHNIKNRKTPPVDADHAAAQLGILMQKIQSLGYEQYEISNFAKPGKLCGSQHGLLGNENPIFGLGPSAHSYLPGRRQWNVANNSLYIKSLENDAIPLQESEELSSAQQANEYIMTSLRTMWGCDLKVLETMAGAAVVDEVLAAADVYYKKGNAVAKRRRFGVDGAGEILRGWDCGGFVFRVMRKAGESNCVDIFRVGCNVRV